MEKIIRGRVLIISFFFPPSLTPRSIQTGKLMPYFGQGIEKCTVITGADQDFEQNSDNRLKQLTRRIERVQVAQPRPRNKFWSFWNNQIKYYLKIPDVFNLWGVKVLIHIVWSKIRFDEVLTISTPASSHLVGLVLKLVTRKPWVAFFSDPFTLNPYVTGNRFETMINKGLEKLIYTNADAIIFTNKYVLKEVVSRNPDIDSSKLKVIPHSFDPQAYPKAGKGRKFVARYIGAFYGDRTPESLFTAISDLSEDLKKLVKIEIVGVLSHEVKTMIDKHRLGGIVKQVSPVPYYESLKLMASADVLVDIDAPITPNLFLSSKMIDYLGANKPVLYIGTQFGAAADVMRSVGLQPINYSDVAQIKNSLTKFMKNHQLHRRQGQIPENIRRQYFSETIAKKYLEILKQVRRNE